MSGSAHSHLLRSPGGGQHSRLDMQMPRCRIFSSSCFFRYDSINTGKLLPVTHRPGFCPHPNQSLAVALAAAGSLDQPWSLLGVVARPPPLRHGAPQGVAI